MVWVVIYTVMFIKRYYGHVFLITSGGSQEAPLVPLPPKFQNFMPFFFFENLVTFYNGSPLEG